MPAADARRIMQHFAELLELGDAEIFPKQDTLKTAKGFGSGVCLPYHHTRAFDAEGCEIESVTAFIDFCWERAVYGTIVLRDLPGETVAASPASRAPAKVKSAIKAADARKQYEQNLATLRNAPEGKGNETLNTVAFFAGTILKGLGKSETEVKKELLQIVCHEWKHAHPESGAETTTVTIESSEDCRSNRSLLYLAAGGAALHGLRTEGLCKRFHFGVQNARALA